MASITIKELLHQNDTGDCVFNHDINPNNKKRTYC